MPFLILDPSAVIRCSTQCEGQVSHAAFYGDLVAKAGIKGQTDQVAWEAAIDLKSNSEMKEHFLPSSYTLPPSFYQFGWVNELWEASAALLCN